jgi:hypothetical protein
MDCSRRQLHDKIIYNLFKSPNIVRTVVSRSVFGMGAVGKYGMRTEFLWEGFFEYVRVEDKR